MPEWDVPLSDVRFRPEEIEAVADVYRSGWLSQGPHVEAFEAALAEFVGSRHAIAVASGTAALQLACVGAGIGPGDEVIVPSLTFAATAAAVVHAGARPVFADIRALDRPWLSADAVEAAIGPATRAIITVGYAGHPGEALALRALADAHGLVLVEDAAHALGARAGEHPAGTIGHAGTFSFFANKNLPLGEGGMLVTDDDALAVRVRLLRSHGMTSGTWDRHRRLSDGYDVLEPGFNYRLDEPRAALGVLLLARLAGDNARRARLAAQYAQSLNGVRPAVADGGEVSCAWHIYPVLLPEAVDRTAFRARLHGVGIQTSFHYPPLHLTRAFSAGGTVPLAVTEAYARRTVTLPMFAHMTEAQLARIVDAVRDAGVSS